MRQRLLRVAVWQGCQVRTARWNPPAHLAAGARLAGWAGFQPPALAPPPPPYPWLQLAKHRGIRTISVVRRQELADELKALG